jgi:hypothetical protein
MAITYFLSAILVVWGGAMILLRNRWQLKYRYRGQPWGEKPRLMTPREIRNSGVGVLIGGVAIFIVMASGLLVR